MGKGLEAWTPMWGEESSEVLSEPPGMINASLSPPVTVKHSTMTSELWQLPFSGQIKYRMSST